MRIFSPALSVLVIAVSQPPVPVAGKRKMSALSLYIDIDVLDVAVLTIFDEIFGSSLNFIQWDRVGLSFYMHLRILYLTIDFEVTQYTLI